MSGKGGEDKASVIILSGFLGAGKTTLLNRLLTSEQGRRTAVIVNEFGEVGIDHHLLLSSEQTVVQMNNGCICCTVRGDLLRSLFDLIEHRSDFDKVIIETTGLAEPGPVAQSLYADARIRENFRLEGVVTVADAKHVGSQLEQSAEACEQIAFADLILLNKTDLSTPEELDRVEEQIGRLNRIARIFRTRNSDIDLRAVFGLQAADFSGKADLIAVHDDHDDHHDDDHHHGDDGHRHHHYHHGHNHLQDIVTVSIVEPGETDGLKLSLWFRSLMTEFGANILRMKGILNLRGDEDRFIFQGVQMEYEGRPGPAWAADETRVNRLVFIGRKLDPEKIRTGFESCRAEGPQTRPLSPGMFGGWGEISPLTLDQIRFWMRQNFALSKDVPIVIKEVPCIKPNCPPIETAIVAVLKNEPPRYFKIQKTISEITFDHVYDLIENPMPCC